MNDTSASHPLKKVYRRFGLLGLAYAITIALFGLIGYFTKGSHISLISGSFFGIVLLYLTTWLLKERKWSLYAFISTNALLCAIFFIRFLKTKTIYPSLTLFFVSVLVLTIGVRIMKHLPKASDA